jgi:hypothetical protein
MANDSTSSPIKPYQQIIASGSGAVLTALFMTLVILKLYSRLIKKIFDRIAFLFTV